MIVKNRMNFFEGRRGEVVKVVKDDKVIEEGRTMSNGARWGRHCYGWMDGVNQRITLVTVLP